MTHEVHGNTITEDGKIVVDPFAEVYRQIQASLTEAITNVPKEDHMMMMRALEAMKIKIGDKEFSLSMLDIDILTKGDYAGKPSISATYTYEPLLKDCPTDIHVVAPVAK